jgi:hypothetical protein
MSNMMVLAGSAVCFGLAFACWYVPNNTVMEASKESLAHVFFWVEILMGIAGILISKRSK